MKINTNVFIGLFLCLMISFVHQSQAQDVTAEGNINLTTGTGKTIGIPADDSGQFTAGLRDLTVRAGGRISNSPSTSVGGNLILRAGNANIGTNTVPKSNNVMIYAGDNVFGGTNGSIFNGDISFFAGDNLPERMRIVGDSGNVGIGMINPTEKLEVSGNVKAAQFIGDGSMLTNVDQQDLSLSGETLNLTNDATSVDLGAFINNWTINNRDIAFGFDNVSTGNKSTAVGSDNDATGDFSGAFGHSSEATGDRSSSIGFDNAATGNTSSAFGSFNVITGAESSGFGFNTLSDVFGLVVVGRFNEDPAGSATSFVGSDPVFMIGNGRNENTRKTALTVLKNGNIGINITNPQAKLDIDGTARIRNLQNGSGNTVVADSDGDLFISNSSPNVNEQRINDLELENELLKAENAEIKTRLAKIEALLNGKVELNTINAKITDATLQQNAPNPFSEATTINYFIPEQVKSASLQVLDQNGRIIKSIPIQATGEGQVTLQANLLSAGTYSYSLVLDGKVIETKQMVLTH
ncbi:MAG: T9SS type A sorting domain-containing protein [Bacteroidota bacterium]